nr:SDR family NAD(P)-dependent oxidoreductase [uncultured Shinella sp.]
MNTIPRTAAGDVDSDALAGIAPVCTGTVALLAAQEGVGSALGRKTATTPLHHIEDIAAGNAVLGERYEAVTLESLSARAEEVAARQAVIEGDVVVPMDEAICIADVLDRAALAQTGIRFVTQHGVKRVGYGQFRDNVLQQAAALHKENLGLGQSLILCQRDAEEFIVAFWACLHAGITAIPLRPPRIWSEDDPIARRFRHMYTLLDTPAVLADEADRSAIRSMLGDAGLPSPRLPVLAEGKFDAQRPHRWAPTQPAMITFTSGSTGLPKGVPLSAANLVSTPRNLQKALDLSAEDTLLSIMSLDHAGSLVGFCGAAIWSGADLVVAPLDPVLAEPALLVDWLEREGITHSWAPDFLWQLLGRAADETQRTADLGRLKALISGGESVRRDTFVMLKQALARHGVSKKILRTAWGMSETTSFMTLSPPWDDAASHALKGGILDNGRPLGGNAFRIVDAAGNVLPETMTGRLQARGISVFSGYSKNQEQSHTDDGWMTTGDLAEMHDGRTIICGREKEMLIVNGQNIPQVEIEGQIERLAGVLANHVVAVATRNTLSAREELVIFAVAADDTLPDDARAKLIGQISGTVAGFCGAKPAHVLLVQKSDIPKTGIGKLQRSLLRKAFEKGDFDRHIKANDILLQNSRLVFSDPRQPCWVPVRPGLEGSIIGRSFLLLGEGLEELGSRLRALGARVAETLEAALDGSDLTIIDGRPLRIPPADSQGLYSAIADLATLSSDLARLGVSRVELLVLTRRGFGLPGDTPTPLPTGDVLFGAINALSSENPGLTARLLELDAESRPGVIIPWLCTGFPGKALAARSDVWQALRLGPPVDRDDADGSQSFKPEDVVLVTGGLGRIGRHLARRLAIVGGCRVVIAGRRASADVSHELAAITENADGRIVYIQADIRNMADVENLFGNTRRIFGQPPSIVLNLAGETGRSPIATVDADVVENFLSARIAGSANLAQSLAAHGGGTLVSLGSAFASIGTHDHMARLSGEAALAGMASRLTKTYGNVRQVCLLSAPWLTEDQPPGFANYLRRQGLHPLTPLQGLAGIVEILDSTDASGVVTLGIDATAPAWADFAADAADCIEEITVETETDRDRCLDALATLFPGRHFPIALKERPINAQADAGNGPVGIILAIWRDVLGERPFHPEQNFFDAGGTSIAATKVHARLVEAGYRTISLIDIFVHPTPNALASLLHADGKGNGQPPGNLLDEARRRQERRQTARRDRRPAALRT